MNKFTSKDEEGRILFQQYCSTTSWCKYNKSAKDEFSPWDVSYTSGSTQVIGEIKMREYASDAFDGWFLEEKKLKELSVIRKAVIDKQKDSLPTPVIHYINMFTDGQIMIWDITNLEGTVEQIKLNKTTMGDTFKVDKGIITLPTYNNIIIESMTPIAIGNPLANPEDDVLPF
jgi:hypothetical protein